MQLELPFQGSVISAPAFEEPAVPRQPHIEFVRMRRARRYILRVRPDGSLRVTVPRGGSKREAELFLRQNQHWVERERQRVHAQHAPAAWKPGMLLLLRGVPVPLRVEPCGAGYTVTYGERCMLVRDVADLRKRVESDLREIARVELIARLQELAADHAIQVPRVCIRNQGSRWGSCSRSGTIALNFRLVQMPPAVRDYVLIHELMHVRQQNHSRRFWRLVEAACPSFRDAERWLRTTGRSLF